MSPNYISISGPRPLGTDASTIPSATEMSRLSRALKRLKGKPKQTKDESALSMSSATEVSTSQPLQSDPKPSLGAPNKTSPTRLLAQGSHGLNSVLKATTTIPAPKAKPQPTPKATPQAPKLTPKSVSIPKPAVQTHAGLYSGFTPSVAAVDQPSPKTLSEAQRTALDILYGASPSGHSVPKTRRQYTRQDDYNVAQNTSRVAVFGSSTISSKPSYSAGFSNISYASPLPYSSTEPLETFRTGGPLGGGQYSSTGGAIGGESIAQTGGRFGEGSVSKTGGSLGEALGIY